MEGFNSGEEASRWLEERLLTLEEAVRQSPELRRLITDGTRDVLIDVDANPHMFYQDATDRLRRYTGQVSQVTLRRLEREGFQRGVLERSSMELLGRGEHLAREILRAMAETLRERTEILSQEGTAIYGEGRDAFTEAIEEISGAMKVAAQTWSTKGPGRHQDSVLPWRRRRAERANPMDDPTFRKSATNAVAKHRHHMEEALRSAGRGSALLATSKYYGDIVDVLSAYIAVGENLHRNGRVVALAAHQRLSQIRKDTLALSSQGDRSADSVMLDDETLDAVLARLDINPRTFLLRNDLPVHDLATLSRSELEETVRAWVEEQLGGLGGTSLAETLGGLTGDTPRVRRRLLKFLARGQPLMHFNDDLPLNFEGGMRGQCSVLVESSDNTLNDALHEACHQMDLPNPHIHVVPSGEDGVMSLRVLQFVAGLPCFAQVDRLMPMIDIHSGVFTDGEHTLSPSIPPGVLKDMPDSAELGELLPPEIEHAFRQEHALAKAPSPQEEPAPTQEPVPDSNNSPQKADPNISQTQHVVLP